MPSVHSEVVSYRGQGGGGLARRGAAEEEWVTKKKVEITTTKNVERKIHRQLVLEDGRVVEEELPTVTVDTTEDKQTFETDQDEERQLEGGEGVIVTSSRFDTKGGVLLGDKFTSVKKINDVRENCVRTEAVQNLGDIAPRHIQRVLGPDREDIRKYLRSRESHQQQNVVVAPRTTFTSRNHRVVTDKEDVQERNWLNNGKMQNERIKTEEHVEYDSDDSKGGSSSSSSASSHHKLEPEVYKTRKDENFTEYFKVGKDKTHVKVAEGPHHVSESKEVQRQEDRQALAPPRRPQPPLRLAEVELRDQKERGRARKPVTHTDSWLERHFGSTSSSLSNSSVDLSRPASREGYGGLRRSNSICDIRPVDNSSGVYYATVRKSGKVPPQVVLRDKGERSNSQAAQQALNRQSLQLSPSGAPVRPPRRRRPESASYGGTYEGSQGSRRQEAKEYTYGSLQRGTERATGEGKENSRETYFFGHPVTVQKSPSVRLSSTASNYQAVSEGREARSTTLGRHSHRTAASTGNIHRLVREGRDSPRSLQGREDRPASAQAREPPRPASREPRHLLRDRALGQAGGPGGQGAGRPARYRSSQELYSESRQRGEEARQDSQRVVHRHRSSDHSGPARVPAPREEARGGRAGSDAERKRKQSLWKEERRGRPVDIYASSREIGVRPRGPGQDPGHRIIYSTESPAGSPSTKYRTKIIVGGPG